MPIGFITAMLARAEYEYIQACRQVRAGMIGNAAAQRSLRDSWWNAYRCAKAKNPA